ncbi:hypothetical protein L1887_48897 [Cichorium endivia]|nr:hypothetical protein L1887_48897 [Cichorium endivia]
MQDLCSAAARVSEAESLSSNPDAVLDRGHGLHQLHAAKPFLHAVFARDPTSGQEYTLSLGVQALDLPSADPANAKTIKPSFALTPQAEEVLHSSSAKDPATSLGSVPSPVDAGKRVPLHFVVRFLRPSLSLDPPRPSWPQFATLRRPRRVAALPLLLSLHLQARPGSKTSSLSSWAERTKQSPVNDEQKPRRCIFTLAQTVESVRSTQSQGLVVDSLPASGLVEHSRR